MSKDQRHYSNLSSLCWNFYLFFFSFPGSFCLSMFLEISTSDDVSHMIYFISRFSLAFQAGSIWSFHFLDTIFPVAPKTLAYMALFIIFPQYVWNRMNFFCIPAIPREKMVFSSRKEEVHFIRTDGVNLYVLNGHITDL